MLTRNEMERIIGEGRSVMYEDRIITNLADLPSEAALAIGDDAKTKIAAESLDAQIARLQAARDSLNPVVEVAPVSEVVDAKTKGK